MTRLIHRFLVVAAAIALGLPAPAAAQAFYCWNCSTIEQQLVDAANQIRALEQQVLQVEYELNAWQTLVQNTISLPQRIFGDVAGEINRIEGLADQVAHFSDQVKFMVDNLGQSGGWGGSLADIPLAIAQEDRALSDAIKRLGIVTDEIQPLREQYVAKLDSLEGTAASGTTQAIQVGNSIAATIGQEAAAQANVTNSALQALATAEVRRAGREAMYSAWADKMATAYAPLQPSNAPGY